METKDVKVFVIALDGVPRNYKLVESLIAAFPKRNVFVLDAVQPNYIDSILLRKLSLQSSLMLGRKVTPREIAVTLSHNQCYKIAHKFEWQNVMIFEDDVLIEDSKILINILDSLPERKKPLIRTFYSPRWGIWKIKDNEYRAVIPPAYAAAYIINKSAIDIAVKRGSIGLADWPIWSNKINFQFLNNNIIKILDVESYLEKERSELKQKKTDYKQIFNPKFIIKVSIFLRIQHQVIFPIIWKIYRYSQVKRMKYKHDYNSSIFLN